MKTGAYPFSAIVEQEQMKLALLLAAIDWRLGVLLRGDKGAGKTTTARALATLLPEPAPFVNLPIGVTEDRLLGGLHLESALKGEPLLKPGLLSEAHGGVLYIDEVNLLPAHLGDALLDTAVSGINVIEREGFSATHPAEFVLLGSMNPEEGLLRPQLLDRFALSVDIEAPMTAEERRMIVARRLAFEREPELFLTHWSRAEADLREKIRHGRDRLPSVICSEECLGQISAAICEAGVRSLRADLAAVRASVACAALLSAASVEWSHVESILPLVLNHRRKPGARSPLPPPSDQHRKQEQKQDLSQAPKQIGREVAERIFAPLGVEVPAVHFFHDEPLRRGNNRSAPAESRGPVVGTRRAASPREIDVRATLLSAVTETGSPMPRAADVHEKVRSSKSSVRHLFLIDSSGSHAAHEKMARVKGAALGLLYRSFRKEDDVAIIAFRGADARVLLEPSQQIADAITALEYLPTGGRTPLAHALNLAQSYLTPSTLLVLLTDGRANVSLKGGDPWKEALAIAGTFKCRALVIDTDAVTYPPHRLNDLAEALKAPSISLADISEVDTLALRS